MLGMLESEEVQLSWVWLRGSVAVWILPPVSETRATAIETKLLAHDGLLKTFRVFVGFYMLLKPDKLLTQPADVPLCLKCYLKSFE